jgi:arginase
MKTPISIIVVPYDSAHFNERMGAGPLHIIDSGLVKQIETGDNKVLYTEITIQEKFPTEVATSFKLLKLLRTEIDKATQFRSLPIVLSGNCSVTVGVISGLNSNDVAVIWFDAHGDCETPATTTTGFLDGMGISMLLNQSWQAVLSLYELNSCFPGKNLVLIGARDLSQNEERFIAANKISRITVEEIRRSTTDRLKNVLADLIRSGIQKVHLHIDVDVIDPLVAPSNSYQVENGLTKNELLNLIDCCINEMPLASATIASYDPLCDPRGDMVVIVKEIIETIVKRTPNRWRGASVENN